MVKEELGKIRKEKEEHENKISNTNSISKDYSDENNKRISLLQSVLNQQGGKRKRKTRKKQKRGNNNI